jgi:hypothetical protein
VCISAGAARPTVVEHNDLGGQSIVSIFLRFNSRNAYVELTLQNLIEEVEATVMEESCISTEETANAANVRSYVPTHLICTICQDDLSEFWDKSVNVPKDDFVRHHEICWKKRPRNLPNAPDTNTAQYMGTKNLCTISKVEAKKVPSRVSNPTHCACCNKHLVEMDVVDAVVHKMNCFHAYCVQQEAPSAMRALLASSLTRKTKNTSAFDTSILAMGSESETRLWLRSTSNYTVWHRE